MKECKTYGEIDGTGKLKIFHRSEFLQSLKSTFTETRVEIIVRKAYKKRSNAQNAYYWGVIVPDFICGFKETTGEIITGEDAHALLKQNCNSKEIVSHSTGEVLKIGITTTNLSTVEMEEYFERCRMFIFEYFGITTLLPGEQSEIMFTDPS